MDAIPDTDPRAVALVDAIRAGDLSKLGQWIEQNALLTKARITSVHNGQESTRSTLHIVADWPGHFPNGAQAVAMLVAAGADPNARHSGPHTETALHWAASSNDVTVLDALIDAGADLEADGAVIAGGTPLMDAVAFGQWNAARRLVERGAVTNLWQAAALGLMDRVEEFLAEKQPEGDELNSTFWVSCHGGQLAAARRFLDLGADLNWLPSWGERVTPLDAARRSDAYEVLTWLHSRRARSAHELEATGR